MSIKVRAKDFVKALWINERYQAILKQKISLKGNPALLNEWKKRKSLLTEKDFEDIFSIMDYKEELFALAIDERLLEMNFLEELVLDSTWFQVLSESLEEESSRELKSISAEEVDYYIIVRNFLNYAEERIKLLNLDTEILNSFLRGLMTKLLGLAHKTIVLEINRARLMGNLVSETSQERYCEFFESHKDINQLVDFYKSYPVLARLMSKCTYDFVENTIAFSKRYDKHKNEIYEQFHISKETKLCSAAMDMGDSHENGKTVILLEYSDGSKVVYKPKELDITLAYNEFCKNINALAGETYIKTYHILCYEDYTFEEFVKQEECCDKSEVHEFYRNFGRLSCLLFYLNGNDFHRENIIASKNYPVVIDLETLLQRPNKSNFDNNFYMQQKKRILSESIARTSIFPNVYSDSKMDMSALNGASQEIPYEVERVKDEKLDTIHYVYEKMTSGDCTNKVTLCGETINAFDYGEDIIDGFRQMYTLLMDHKKELLSYISVFENKKCRMIIRNTMNYARMQQMALHPRCMRDALEREKLFENLWKYSLGDKVFHKSEIKDILENDIPIFFCNTSTNDVIDSFGNIIKGYYDESGMEALKNETNGLSLKNLEKQMSLIKLMTKQYSPIVNSRTNVMELKSVLSDHAKDRDYVKLAEKIGDSLIELAHYNEDKRKVSFDGIFQAPNGTWTVDVMRGNFYEGMAGMELFFHYLYQATGKEKYQEFENILHITGDGLKDAEKINSAMSGKWSFATAAVLGEKGDKDEILEVAQEILHTEDVNYADWLNGAASFVQILIYMYEKSMDIKILDVIEQFMDEIQNELKDHGLLGGFSHGYSSLAYLYGKVYALTGKSNYYLSCMELIGNDNKFFNEELGGWTDERLNNGEMNYHWCHGSLGIGLSRWLLREKCHIMDDVISRDIEIADASVTNSFLTKDDTLCHGNAGKVDYFIEKYLLTQDDRYLAQAKSIMNFIVDKAEYGTGGLPEFPNLGLFTGVAGIGYELLRLVNPGNMPSVLALQ